MKSSITDVLYRIKGAILGELFVVLIIIFVGFSGFGLGRLSALDDKKEPIKIEYAGNLEASSAKSLKNAENVIGSEVKPTEPGNQPLSGGLVGSKNGSKYHFPWCPGAKRIKKENEIWFDTREEAERAGYGPALNCKGL